MSLLDRFRQPVRRKTLADEVATNVASILSTRRGYGAVLNDFGISDTGTDINRAVLIKRMTEEITDCLQKYETRLINVKVKADDENNSASRLSLSISGCLREGGEPIEVILDPIKGVALLVNRSQR